MITRLADRATLFALRLLRALLYYRRLHYSWHLAWTKSGWSTFP